ncbi:MAG: FtsX-like permease family protein [Thermoleophilia bacterium]|nr:FtsX-like permease family protein [Thermoleophilia bacterium]
MIRFALRAVLARKLRTTLTALAIVLGVAMISGTYVLTDSIDRAFDRLFSEIRATSTAVVTGKPAFDLAAGGEPSFAESLLEEIRALPGVAEAEGGVDSDSTQIIGRDGKALVFGGAPNLGFSIADGESRFNPLVLVEGSWPGPNEVAIDARTASEAGFVVGETIGIQAEGPIERLRLAGTFEFPGGLSLGGATLAGFDLPTAQRLFGKVGRLDEIAIAAKPGVEPEELVAQVEEVLPPTTQVRTGAEQAAAEASETSEFISFLRTFLLAFAGIALFVGSFVIANSLSITIAQRTREFATLRTIGATSRQVLASVLLESLVVGTVASVVGVFAGLLLATGLFELFDAGGFTLPNTGLVLETRTVVVALAAGIGVTVLASVYPGLRATSVPPIAAVREGATLPGEPLDAVRGVWQAASLVVLGAGSAVAVVWFAPGGTILSVALAVVALALVLLGCSLFPSRSVGAIVSGALGLAALLYGLFAPELGTTKVLLWIGIGVLLAFFAAARVTTPLIPGLAAGASPVARWSVLALSVLAWPLFTLPFWLLRRGAWGPGKAPGRAAALVWGALLNPLLALLVLVLALARALTRWEPEWPRALPGVVPDASTSRIGRENARRSPQRTASTASALMIGLALVTLVATLAAGIVQTFRSAVDELWKESDSDYGITAQNNFSPIPIDAAEAAARAPGVVAVMNVRTGQVRVLGETIFATAVDPTARELINLRWREGAQDVLAELGAEGAFVDDGFADEHDLGVGSTLELTFPEGKQGTFVVRGVFEPPTGGSPFGDVTISTEAWDARVATPRNLYSFVAMEGDVTPENTAALEAALADFPNAKVQTREEFVESQIEGLNAVLNILYVLLALSVLVSVFGIVNTLVLTVFERTREIGMLRAIGMTRTQVRRMIRHEAVITALVGAAVGIVLGLVLAVVLIARVDFIDFAFPTAQVVVFVVASVLVGIVAAILPARRAARLDPLEAIAYE